MTKKPPVPSEKLTVTPQTEALVERSQEMRFRARVPSCLHTEGARYSLEHDNYYCAQCSKGMWQAYYDYRKQSEACIAELEESLAAVRESRRLERVRATDAEIALNEARTLIGLQRAQIEQDLRVEKQTREQISRLEADVAELRKRIEKDDHDLSKILSDRDDYHDAADELAYAIADAETIGEHSNANNPWERALEALEVERERHDSEVAKLQREFRELEDAVNWFAQHGTRVGFHTWEFGYDTEQLGTNPAAALKRLHERNK